MSDLLGFRHHSRNGCPKKLGPIYGRLLQAKTLALEDVSQVGPDGLRRPPGRVLQPAVGLHLARLARYGHLAALVDAGRDHRPVVLGKRRVSGREVVRPPVDDDGRG